MELSVPVGQHTEMPNPRYFDSSYFIMAENFFVLNFLHHRYHAGPGLGQIWNKRHMHIHTRTKNIDILLSIQAQELELSYM